MADPTQFKTAKINNRTPATTESFHFRYVVTKDDGTKIEGNTASVDISTIGNGVAPAAVTGLTYTPKAGDMIFKWNANTEGDLDGYEITISDGTDITTNFKTFKLNATTYTLARSEIISIFGIALQTIRFSIKAVDTGGNKSAAATVVVQLVDDTDGTGSLKTTSTPVLTAGIESLSVTWDGKAVGNVAYSVNIDRVEATVTPGNKTIIFTGASTQTLSGLTGGITYTVYLKAYDKFGRVSAQSTPASIEVRAVPAAEPETPKVVNAAALTATGVFAGINLTWNGTFADSSTKLTGFDALDVYAATAADAATFTFVGSFNSTGTQTIFIPVNGTTIAYGVTSYFKVKTRVVAGSTPATTYPASAFGTVLTATGTPQRASETDLGPGAVTIAKLKGNVLVFDNIKAGTLSAASFFRVGAMNQPDGFSSSGARIEMSSSTANIISVVNPLNDQTVSFPDRPIQPGLSVYLSGQSPTFQADLSGNVKIDLSQSASSTFTAGSTGANKFVVMGKTEIDAVNTSGIYVGNDFSSAPFRVAFNGNLKATQADITGEVKATSGKIGGWNIVGDQIRSMPSGTDSITTGTVTKYPMVIDAATQTIQFNQGQAGSFVLDVDSVTVPNTATGSYSGTGVEVVDGEVVDDQHAAYSYFYESGSSTSTTAETISIKRYNTAGNIQPKITLSTGANGFLQLYNRSNPTGNVLETSYILLKDGGVVISTQKGFQIKGMSTAAHHGYTNSLYGLTGVSGEAGAMLVAKSDGTVSRGRAIFKTTGKEVNITSTSISNVWRGVGLEGDLLFSTNN
jgi:hypothetical protein